MPRSSRTRLGLRASCAAAALAFCAAFPAASASAATYGLIIGVDDYAGVSNDLQGAVNDANDIAASLTANGAAEVVLFTDAAATKAAIEANWFRLVETARTGDTLVFSFAGHGSQEPEPPGRNGEADGKNENFLLGGYSPSGPAAAERIVDDEMFAWLKMADDKGIEVVFIADSCHSGTMFRSVGSRTVRYRNGNFRDPDLSSDILVLPPPAMAVVGEEDFSFVTFIGATQENRLTPELMIDGNPRGALSWAFSRAMEGAADADGDGALTQQELLAYLVPTVESQAENQQIPQILPLRAEQKPIITLASRGVNAPPPPPPPPPLAVAPAGTLVRFYVNGVLPGPLPAIPGVFVTTNEAEADLIWDVAGGFVDHRVGGRVAENVGPDGIPAVLSKWSAIGFIKEHMAAAPVSLALPTGNQTYKYGEIVQVMMSGARFPYLTLFNLPPDGKVEFFLPGNAREATTDWRGRIMSEELRVQNPPFGAEHLVAILTPEPATALHSALQTMGTANSAAGLAAVLATLLNGKEFQAGLIGIYTTGEQ